jgi:hypothetical protein
MTDALEAAHEYVKRGWGVVPLYGIAEDGACRCRAGRLCPVKNRGKHPNGTRSGTWPELWSGADVQAWLEDHPDDNIGIITGARSGLFVLDVDGAAGVNSLTQLASERGALPATRMVRTGSGGLHYYFRHPGHFTVRNSTSWIARGIDIRGEGGQVVAPPSVSGLGEYTVISDTDIAEAPAWLLDVLAEHAAHVDAGRNVEVASAVPVPAEMVPPAVDNLRMQMVPDGQRHQHFYALVAECYEAGFSQGETVTIVAPWCAAVDKFVGRVEQEVARSWGKLLAAKARESDWLAQASNAPGGPVNGANLRLVQDGDVGQAPLWSAGAPDQATGTQDDPLAALAPSTWAAVDLGPHLDGTWKPLEPTLLPRSDGVCLLYPGLVHSFHGESESGKSMIAQAEVSRVLNDGGSAAYLDFESDAGSIVGRLLEMGTDPEALRDSFSYRQPDVDYRKFPHEREAFAELASGSWDIIVIDGMTDALNAFGASSIDNDDIAKFMRVLPRTLAVRTGAAVVLVDHVTKDTEGRGRFAVGGQAKMAGLDGAAYTVDVRDVIGRGMRGVIELRVAKDRPGGVRPHCAVGHTNRTQQAALVVVDSRGGRLNVVVGQPDVDDTGAVREWRPTIVMERISEYLQIEGEASGRQIKLEVTGSNDHKTKAIRFLREGGFITLEGEGRNQKYRLVRPYYSADEIASEDPESTESLPSPYRVPEPGSPTESPESPPLSGGDSTTDSVESEAGPATESVAQEPFQTAPCPMCSEPTPTVILGTWEMCGKCAHEAGLT